MNGPLAIEREQKKGWSTFFFASFKYARRTWKWSIDGFDETIHCGKYIRVKVKFGSNLVFFPPQLVVN